ncbi:MAG: hypothetical protein QOJ99_372, partial [Bryobacterales bacterium]|nr:hypothetical protein [Bryobacterales bacterium]
RDIAASFQTVTKGRHEGCESTDEQL